MDRPPDRTDARATPPGARHPAPPRRTPARQIVGLVGICLLGALWPPGAAVQELIANRDLDQSQGSRSELSRNELNRDVLSRNEARLFFTLRRQLWPDERPVRVFVLADEDPLHVAFVKDVLGLFPYQLRGVWDRQVFSGTGQAPTLVANEAEMIARVATTPGALGYAWSPPRDPRIRTLEVR